jgi:predicted SprT family Zn-dependent metalloprotease
MISRAQLPQRRPIYDDDLKTRMEAAMARTRMLLKCSRAIRATVHSQYSLPFTPRCAVCQQSGRSHDAPLTSEQHYICARCQARWAVTPTPT